MSVDATTFKQLQDAVISSMFTEADRVDVKNWIVSRHAWLWDVEPWRFKYATATVTFTSGSQTVASVPADLFKVMALYDSNGDPVKGFDDIRRFLNFYNANSQMQSTGPSAYTVIDGVLMIGPLGDGTSGEMLYEKTKPALSADADTTGLPDGYAMSLVHGAKAEGAKLRNIGGALAADFDADFTAAVNAMRAAYLSSVGETGQQFGAYRPTMWDAFRP